MKQLGFFLATSVAFGAAACSVSDVATTREPLGVAEPQAQSCDGDGVCNPDCGVPDLECYITFATHQEIAAFFEQELEPALAAAEQRPPRAVVPESDPWYARLNGYLHDGWQAYARTTPIGALPEPALLIVEDPVGNAFAAPSLSGDASVLAVVVQTGLLNEDMPAEQYLGLLFHELEHAVQLHGMLGRREALRVFYSATAGQPEPLGFEMTNDAATESGVKPWIALATEAGAFPEPEMLGLPYWDTARYIPQPWLAQVLEFGPAAVAASNPEACQASVEARAAWLELIAPRVSIAFNRLQPDAQLQAELRAASQRYADAASECMRADDTQVPFDFLQSRYGAVIAFDAEDQTLFEAAPDYVTGVRALISRRHEQMNQMLDPQVAELARYYSIEERADDRAVRVLAEMGLPPTGIADFLEGLIPEPERTECEQLLDAGEVPPYGVLSDDHHSPCFRISHVRALAAELD